MKIIDMEHHYYSEEFFEIAAQNNGLPHFDPETGVLTFIDGLPMPLGPIIRDRLISLGELRVKEMDTNGLDVAVLGTSAGPELIQGEAGIALAQSCNDAVYETVQKYPGRFLGSATLPVCDVEASCQELERCVREYGFVSWQTHSNYGDTSVDEKRYWPILKKAEELGVYVYLHPHAPADPRMHHFGYMFAAAGLGYTTDTMITIMSMIVGGVFDEFPKLKVVLGHLGEALPFLMERMDNRFTLAAEQTTGLYNKRKISDYFKDNIFVTTSGNMSAPAFNLAKEVLGIDHIMVGTDYPYEILPDMMQFLDELKLTKEEREMLYYKNAEQLIK